MPFWQPKSKHPMRMTALLLAVLLLVGACGCQELPQSDPSLPSVDNSSTETPSTDASIDTPTVSTVALCLYSGDTVDPYRTVTRTNLDLATLLYDGLTVLDADGTPTPLLAESVEQTEPRVWTATLREDAVFSDGTAVTALDVQASFARAKASDPYATRLENVTAAQATDLRTVRFTLASEDTQTAACLTFPIQKCVYRPTQTTTAVSTDSSAEPPAWNKGWLDVPLSEGITPPTGTGRYVFDTDPTGGYRLTDNANDDRAMNLSELKLVNLAGEDAMLHALESGTIHYFYSDLTDTAVLRTTAATASVALTELVYLGVDLNDTVLRSADVRQALSLAIDRDALCHTAFEGFAEPTALPWSRAFASTVGFSGRNVQKNLTKSLAKWASAGYNTSIQTSEDGAASDAAAKPLSEVTLSLLYCNDTAFKTDTAMLLGQQLEACGITVELQAAEYSEYKRRVQRGDFDLYLGDLRLPPDGSLRAFFARGGSAAVGGLTACDTAGQYAAYLAGEMSQSAFAQEFAEQLPFIPLCGRMGVAVYNRRLQGVAPTAFDLYADIERWSFMN